MAKELTINAVAMGNLKHRRRQYAALVTGVILAMIFSCGVPFFISCSHSSEDELKDRQIGRQDLVILDAQQVDMEAFDQSGLWNGPAGYLHILSYGFTDDQEKGTAIGWMDDRAKELYYPQVLEGRLPEAAGEIAIERNSLLRMGLEQAKIGQAVSLHEFPANESEYLSEQTDKSYTLVGILDNRKVNFEHTEGDTRYKAAKIPAAFVSDQEVAALGGKENLIALLGTDDWNGPVDWFVANHTDYEHIIHTFYRGSYSMDLFDKLTSSTNLVTALALLLAFLSCFGIANAFASNLKERKKQIGMLRAVGATRRQIIQIFGREAVLIALICAPASIAVAYFGVKLFASVMGDAFVFLPSLSVLLSGAGFGFAVVILSALIPLLAISRISPMQAIRDTELMRKMKHKRVKSQHQFQMDRLLAKRKMMFQRGRQIAVSLILAFTTVVCFVAVGEGISWTEDFRNLQELPDYEVHLNGWSSEGSPFEFKPELNDTISEAQRQEALLLPGVEQVSGRKRCMVNMLIQGEFPEYLAVNEYASWNGRSRFDSVAAVCEKTGIEITRENLREQVQANPNLDYVGTRQWAGYEQELFSAPLTAQTGDLVQQLSSSVIEGSINLEKLDAGEEVILNAPPKIGFSFYRVKNGYHYGLMDLTEEAVAQMTESAKEDFQYLLAEAESPFHVGDTLTLSMLTRDDNGQPIRQDRQVRVGAIVSDTSDMYVSNTTEFRIITTVAGLDHFGQALGYDGLNINLSQEVTPELDRQMQSELEAIFPGKQIESRYATNQRRLASFKNQVVTAAALILVLSTVSVSLVNNSISAQIREGKRTIGTLRAVGASQRDIIRSYLRQILYMTVLGVILGTAAYSIISLVMFRKYGQTLGEFVLWPAPILFVAIFAVCYINLVIQVKKVSRHSIVENIREL